MKRVSRIVGCLALVIALGAPASGDVQVGINIGIPPPPVIASPPSLVVVPTTPAVRYAPDLPINVFFYGGRYYSWHDGAWFAAANVGAPWAYIEPVYVPRPVLVVPARYYKLPPGQLKKLYGTVPRHGHYYAHDHPGHGGGDGHGKGKKHKHRHYHDDDD